MAYTLRNDVHWCVCGGRIIFLDLHEDRYSCLPRSAEESFLRLARGLAEPGDIDRLAPLVRRGMLTADGSPGQFGAPASIPPPSADYMDEPYPRAQTGDLLAVVASQLRWATLLRFRPLAKIVRDVREAVHSDCQPRAEADQRLARTVSAFAAAALLLPSANRCLVRALSMHAICRRQGNYPLLVFGVRVNPFRAHCWVQLDGRVLIGDFEQARLFTPIAALG